MIILNQFNDTSTQKKFSFTTKIVSEHILVIKTNDFDRNRETKESI
jgi:hypothetical protein